MENNKPTMEELKAFLEKNWKERKPKSEISISFIGYHDENGNLVCKCLEMFHNMLKEECNRQFIKSKEK